MRTSRLRIPVFTALIVTLGLTIALGAPAAAQDDSEAPLDLSAAIYSGTCDALGAQPVHQVGDFIPVTDDEIVGSQDIDFSLRAQRTLEADIDDLFTTTATHALVVRDNTDPDGDPVACGELGGVQVNGLIVIGVTETDSEPADEDLVGVAVFGSTEPSGPTTQPAQIPGQLPVQAYISEDALLAEDDEEATTPTVTAPTQAPQVVATPTLEPTAVPTETPTMMPTEAPTMPPTEAPTEAPTMPPTMPPTEVPTEAPTMPPTEAPTEVPTEVPTNDTGRVGSDALAGVFMTAA